MPKPEGMVSLSYAHTNSLIDDSESWPSANCLELDGFTFEALSGEAPTNSRDRLIWLDLQPKNRFHPQPYRQLAKVLREQGHDNEARKILIALSDYSRRCAGMSWPTWVGAGIL
jgi:hypothetical protein